MSTPSDYGADTKKQTDEFQLIENMILYYGCHGEAAAEEIGDLLGALKENDTRKGKLWEDIMD